MQTARQNVVTGGELDRTLGRDNTFPLAFRALGQGTPPRTSVQAVAERMLLDAAERAQRRSAAVHALVLRLSQLPPPGAKPYHRRVARSLLEEMALRRGGQVFALRNLDLVLLGPDVETIRPLLAQLFGGANHVVQVFPPGAMLLAYAQERATENLCAPERASEMASLQALDAAEALLEDTLAGDLLYTQVAAELLPGGTLRPLFRGAIPHFSTLAARLPHAGGRTNDPSPFNDLVMRLDARLLDIACDEFAQGGPLSSGRHGPALHLKLTIATVLAPSFARFTKAVRESGGRAGIELHLAEALADLGGFERASTRVRSAGFTLALDGIGIETLLFTKPGRLGADLVKLDWSPSLAAGGTDSDHALSEIGPARVVLTHADTETALRWGYARQVRRFQGRHVDAMLAAARLGACAVASGCTLRLCAERASAASDAGRAACRNLPLLGAAA